MPRYVILTHDWPFLHWDLLLEDGDKLLAWRLLQEPTANIPVSAEVLPDHRLLYLDYEGPVSGDRGTVYQWDSGTCESLDCHQLLRLSSGRGLTEAIREDANGLIHWTFRDGLQNPNDSD